MDFREQFLRFAKWAGRITGNDRKTQITVLVIVVLFLMLAFGLSARAFASDISFSVGSTVARAVTPTVTFSIAPEQLKFNPASRVEFGMTLIGNYEYGGVHSPNQIVWHASYTAEWRRFSVGLGPAYLRNTDALNSSGMNFQLQLGYRLADHWGLNVRHFSNAGAAKPNTGRDLVEIVYTARFGR